MLILPLQSDLLPVINKPKWDRINADPARQKDERLRCAAEPWYWLVNYVYTIRKDENTDELAEGAGVVERFLPDEYLQYVCHKYFTVRKLALDKSRQLLMNWLISACLLWVCQYHQNEECVCQTQKEKKVDKEIVQRAYGIWEREPGWLKPFAKYSFCSLKVPETKSVIIGVPAGEDQIRSHNPTRYFGDECGFWEGTFEECRTAALACCERVALISTANAGEWDDFINDTMYEAA